MKLMSVEIEWQWYEVLAIGVFFFRGERKLGDFFLISSVWMQLIPSKISTSQRYLKFVNKKLNIEFGEK